MGSQRVGHDWATELNWAELNQNSDGDRPLQQKFYDFAVMGEVERVKEDLEEQQIQAFWGQRKFVRSYP